MGHKSFREKIDNLPPVDGVDTWSVHQKNMIEHMKVGNPDKPWEWSTVVATMYVGRCKMTDYELVETTKAGLDTLFQDEPDASNLNHQRYHFWQWEKLNKIPISSLKTIVEFGGGYGAMALVANKLGFRGHYYIVDYPCMKLLQEYHLGRREIKCKLKFGSIPTDPDLMISLHALSETSTSVRNSFLAKIRPRAYLLSYMRNWLGVDNLKYFQKWANDYFAKGGPVWKAYTKANFTNTHYLVSHAINYR